MEAVLNSANLQPLAPMQERSPVRGSPTAPDKSPSSEPSNQTPRSVVEGRAGPRRACHWQSVGVTHPVRRPSRQVYRSAPAPMRAANFYAGLTVERGHGHKLQRLSAAAADRVQCG